MNQYDTVFNQTIGNWLIDNAWVLVIFIVWSMLWKGLALWRAARNQEVIWFIVLLAVNTLGIIEIVYYFYFSRKKIAEPAETTPKHKS